MIGLDNRVKGKEAGKGGSDFAPIPNGDYDVVVHEIKPWKELVRDSYINKTDDDGKLLRDDNGKVVKEMVKGLK